MAALYITEFTYFGRDAQNTSGNIMTILGSIDQIIGIDELSRNSVTLDPATAVVRLHAAHACSIAFGPDPMATGDSLRIPLNGTEYFKVPVGASYKIAAITN